jgi:thiamine-phosphate pyrophosphorylase
MNFIMNINWKLCLIADSQAREKKRLSMIVNQSVKSGATLVQLRGKALAIKDFLDLAFEIRDILRPKKIPFLINDRIDVALACDADGVHLGQEDLPLQRARKILGKNRLIGISANSFFEALDAEKNGADYIGVGPIFFTPSKKEPGQILGLSGLKAIREKVSIPILAIGGINKENVKGVIQAGADGIAVISAIMSADDAIKATRELKDSIRTALE